MELTLCDDIECVRRTCDTRLCECVGGLVGCDGVTPTRECEPHRFEPALTITPALRDFGEVAQGAIYPTVTFRLENEGAADGRLQPTFEGLGSEALALAPGDCVSRVSPGEVCEIRVILVTSEPRRVAASLRLTEGLAVSVEGLVTAAPIDAGAVDAGLLDAHDAP
ncbi:MAG: hypothetical protein J0L92_01640 [Deltaproteobacteria bacterium]|nr:hypothetical protein [Deltaproteobacteria bacterium]